MGRLVQAVGVLIGIGAAVSFFFRGGNPHSYDITFKSEKGLTAEKHQPEPHLVNSNPGKPTTWTFTNGADEAVTFEMYEKDGCHFTFTPAHAKENCRSQEITVGKGDTRQIKAHVHDWDGKECSSSQPCPVIVNAKREKEEFQKVDPKLQIEDGGLLTNYLGWLLAVASAGLLLGPALFRYLFQRSSTAGR
jgi:hypothetical protein